ncbi:hypothetical protein OPV22_034306 [Ensete ventricosum]|uniref:CRC domain-containing protein n=1 Tax=Ensete ventricosum TaxID=4639 RepID=A0AAV8P320_ENSVE|nr:hypothetical protein OPV22_034306 [Ensete ventricosum]
MRPPFTLLCSLSVGGPKCGPHKEQPLYEGICCCRRCECLMESKGGKKKSSSSNSLDYEAPLGYSIEDIRPHGGIKKFQSAAYSNCAKEPS